MKALIKAEELDQVPKIYEQMLKAGCTPDSMAKDMLRSAIRFRLRPPKIVRKSSYRVNN